MDFTPLVAFIVPQFIRLDGGGIIIFSISIHIYTYLNAHLKLLHSSSNSGNAANNKSRRKQLTRQMN